MVIICRSCQRPLYENNKVDHLFAGAVVEQEHFTPLEGVGAVDLEVCAFCGGEVVYVDKLQHVFFMVEGGLWWPSLPRETLA
jgi:hypothetical protein